MIQRILALAIPLCLATAAFAGGKFASISHDELKQAIADHSVVLLDANGTDSYRDGHIPGAIDFAAQGQELARLLPANKDALIVAYCGNEQCGAYARAAEAARQLGYTNVKHYAKGIAGWRKSGEAVERDT